MSAYAPLLSISVTHSFFSDGLCRGLEFVPTETCRKLIKNCELIIREEAGGIRLFYDPAKSDRLRLCTDDPEDLLSFSFRVFSKAPYFLNYTAPSILREDSILYFDNKNSTSKPSSSFWLNTDEYVSDKDFQKLSSPLLSEIISKRDRLVKPAFVLNICAGEKGVHLFDATSQILYRDYLIRFRNRETCWKYYLVGAPENNSWYISDFKGDMRFHPLDRIWLPGGRSASVFKSETPIPLTEQPLCYFQLREKNSGNGKVLIRRLPVASPAHISKEIQDDTEVSVSEIFVNC